MFCAQDAVWCSFHQSWEDRTTEKKEVDLSETSGLLLRFNYFAEPHGGTWLLQNMRCSDEPD